MFKGRNSPLWNRLSKCTWIFPLCLWPPLKIIILVKQNNYLLLLIPLSLKKLKTHHWVFEEWEILSNLTGITLNVNSQYNQIKSKKGNDLIQGPGEKKKKGENLDRKHKQKTMERAKKGSKRNQQLVVAYSPPDLFYSMPYLLLWGFLMPAEAPCNCLLSFSIGIGDALHHCYPIQ